MSGDDGSDSASRGQFPKRLLDVAMADPPLDPKFCFVKTPWWSQVEPEAQEAYEALVEHLDGCVEVVGLPEIVGRAVEWHKTVNDVELAFCLQREWTHSRDKLSSDLKSRIEAGMAVSAKDYLLAKDRMLHVTNAFDEYFDKFDAILCPAALGAAPKGLGSTGNPIMQTVWSFAGLPSLNLPLMNLGSGLPLGLQAVGAFNNDGRLLRSCRWLVKEFLRRNES
jgi:Asp-tRNA(Asn)/Glu-tRNA(Gln) amidotransferase A subunit family amidase